jgi:hypothetical protein
MNDSIVSWSDQQWKDFSRWLVELLRNQTVELIFTKSDNTVRTMLATKDPSIWLAGMQKKEKTDLPVSKSHRKYGKKASANSDSTITVWDVERNDWRSVKCHRILNLLTLIIKYDYCSSSSEFA